MFSPQFSPLLLFYSFKSYDDVDPGAPSAASKKFLPETNTGPQLPSLRRLGLAKFSKPIDFFRLFFTLQVVSKICKYTNSYAKANPRPSYKKVADKLRPSEFYRYLGLIIYMGFVKLNRLWKYWSKSSLYNLGLPRQTMSLKRFKYIMSCLHVVNHKKEEKTEGRLKKVTYVLDHFKRVCKSVYKPKQNVSVDERMVKSKNRSGIRQYIKNKPVKFGIKLWVLAEADTGYTCDFDVYAGGKDKCANNGQSQNKKGKGKKKKVKGKGLGYNVVTKLCESIKDQGYHVYFDNFFTSGPLLDDLKSEYGILSCGTTMKNRTGYPVQFKSSDAKWAKAAKKGDMRWCREDPKLIVQWKDNKIITVVSTIHSGNASDTCTRRVKNREGKWERVTVRRPMAIREYNKHMGGVDLSDQLTSKYGVLQKVNRWWKTLFLHMIDIAVVNSYIMFNAIRKNYGNNELKRMKSYDQLTFREELVKELTSYGIDDNEVDESSTSEEEEQGHEYDVEKKPTRGNCALCWFSEKKESKVVTYCTVCNKNYCTLYNRNCMEKVHSKPFGGILQKILSSGLKGKKKIIL